VANVRLHRAHHDRVVNSASRRNGLGDGLEFLPVTCLCPRAMALDVAGLGEIKACRIIDSTNIGNLSVPAGKGNAYWLVSN
jgi:hypothetical protein